MYIRRLLFINRRFFASIRMLIGGIRIVIFHLPATKIQWLLNLICCSYPSDRLERSDGWIALPSDRFCRSDGLIT